MASVREVAKIANVSVGSVSRYLNGYEIKLQTRDKIVQAIEQIEGRTFRQLNIGLIVPVLNDSYSGALASEVQQIISKTKHRLIVICSKKLEDDIEYILNSNLDGIIVHPPGKGCEDAVIELAKHLPLVLVDMISPMIKCDQVLVDNVNAVYGAVENLIKKNHFRIAIAVNNAKMLMGNERIEGYRRVLEDYAIPWDDDLVIEVENAESVKDFLCNNKLKKPPTAIVTTNFDITVLCAKAFIDLNLQIPQDMEFVAFDDFGFSRYSPLKPTYIIQPMEAIAKEVYEILIKRICGNAENFPIIRRIRAKYIESNIEKEA